MLMGTCDGCSVESSYLDLFAGQKLKCKKCPAGWVTLPPKAGAAFAEAPRIIPAPVVPAQPAPARIPSKPPLPSHPDAFALPPADLGAYARPDPDPGSSYMTYFLWMTTVLGFGSIWLYFFDLQFGRLAFLERLQPFAGIVMAVAGIFGLIWWYRRDKSF